MIQISDFPADSCPWCEGETHPPLELVGYEDEFIQIGYECSVGHRWFTHWPPVLPPDAQTTIHCGSCGALVRSPDGQGPHRPMCPMEVT